MEEKVLKLTREKDFLRVALESEKHASNDAMLSWQQQMAAQQRKEAEEAELRAATLSFSKDVMQEVNEDLNDLSPPKSPIKRRLSLSKGCRKSVSVGGSPVLESRKLNVGGLPSPIAEQRRFSTKASPRGSVAQSSMGAQRARESLSRQTSAAVMQNTMGTQRTKEQQAPAAVVDPLHKVTCTPLPQRRPYSRLI
jgi:hypothetical protein